MTTHPLHYGLHSNYSIRSIYVNNNITPIIISDMLLLKYIVTDSPLVLLHIVQGTVCGMLTSYDMSIVLIVEHLSTTCSLDY